jgi:16S rRNA (cytosine967-C5)-methyltransferase
LSIPSRSEAVPAHSRTLAAQVLARVIGRRQSLTALLHDTDADLGAREHAFVQELCYGVMRWLPRLEFLLQRLLQRPLRAADADLRALLLTGIYQILYLRTPDHAAVSASVETARDLGKPWACKLVNAVLRRFLREREALEAEAAADPVAHHAHPAWLLSAIRTAWPEDWQAVLAANNTPPPFTLRINRLRIGADEYQSRLAAAGLDSRRHIHARQALLVSPAVNVTSLPGFSDGHVSVQDAAAQLAAGLLDLAPGQRVLDACAAPGGKTAHILESEPGLAEVVAIDSDAERLEQAGQGLERLGLTARCLTADATEPAGWWDGKSFDRILLDAPCSGTGVIRRHPDIKHRRTQQGLARSTELQARLLQNLWPLLAPGGKLLYATCSILPQENADLAAAFIACQKDAEHLPIKAEWGRPAGPGRQILPGEADMDGFYYACLTKNNCSGKQ